MKKTIITNPNPAASRLPSQRGVFRLTPAPPPPIEPVPRKRPPLKGHNVVVTNPRATQTLDIQDN